MEKSRLEPYGCGACKMTFAHAYLLKKHLSVHAKELTFKCKFCSVEFPSKQYVMLHELSHSTNHQFKCEICQKKFKNVLKWNEHQKNHQEQQNFACEICGQKFYSRSKFLDHCRIHNGHGSYQCNFCRKSFISPESLHAHQTKVHKQTEIFSCEYCGKAFVSKSKLHDHLKFHTGSRKYNCDECGRIEGSLTAMSHHKRSHHGIEKYECEECGETFEHLISLKTHKYKHISGNIACDVCGMLFHRRCEMVNHKNYVHITDLHDGFHCDKCPRTFSTAAHLRNHEVVHNKQKSDSEMQPEKFQSENQHKLFLCKFCKRIFNSKVELESHERGHSIEKPYGCNYCNQSYRRARDLRIHLQTHVELNPYRCHLCSSRFFQNNQLLSHIKRMHSGTVLNSSAISSETDEDDMSSDRSCSDVESDVDSAETEIYMIDSTDEDDTDCTMEHNTFSRENKCKINCVDNSEVSSSCETYISTNFKDGTKHVETVPSQNTQEIARNETVRKGHISFLFFGHLEGLRDTDGSNKQTLNTCSKSPQFSFEIWDNGLSKNKYEPLQTNSDKENISNCYHSINNNRKLENPRERRIQSGSNRDLVKGMNMVDLPKLSNYGDTDNLLSWPSPQHITLLENFDGTGETDVSGNEDNPVSDSELKPIPKLFSGQKYLARGIHPMFNNFSNFENKSLSSEQQPIPSRINQTNNVVKNENCYVQNVNDYKDYGKEHDRNNRQRQEYNVGDNGHNGTGHNTRKSSISGENHGNALTEQISNHFVDSAGNFLQNNESETSQNVSNSNHLKSVLNKHHSYVVHNTNPFSEKYSHEPNLLTTKGENSHHGKNELCFPTSQLKHEYSLWRTEKMCTDTENASLSGECLREQTDSSDSEVTFKRKKTEREGKFVKADKNVSFFVSTPLPGYYSSMEECSSEETDIADYTTVEECSSIGSDNDTTGSSIDSSPYNDYTNSTDSFTMGNNEYSSDSSTIPSSPESERDITTTGYDSSLDESSMTDDCSSVYSGKSEIPHKKHTKECLLKKHLWLKRNFKYKRDKFGVQSYVSYVLHRKSYSDSNKLTLKLSIENIEKKYGKNKYMTEEKIANIREMVKKKHVRKRYPSDASTVEYEIKGPQCHASKSSIKNEDVANSFSNINDIEKISSPLYHTRHVIAKKALDREKSVKHSPQVNPRIKPSPIYKTQYATVAKVKLNTKDSAASSPRYKTRYALRRLAMKTAGAKPNESNFQNNNEQSDTNKEIDISEHSMLKKTGLSTLSNKSKRQKSEEKHIEDIPVKQVKLKKKPKGQPRKASNKLPPDKSSVSVGKQKEAKNIVQNKHVGFNRRNALVESLDDIEYRKNEDVDEHTNEKELIGHLDHKKWTEGRTDKRETVRKIKGRKKKDTLVVQNSSQVEMANTNIGEADETDTQVLNIEDGFKCELFNEKIEKSGKNCSEFNGPGVVLPGNSRTFYVRKCKVILNRIDHKLKDNEKDCHAEESQDASKIHNRDLNEFESKNFTEGDFDEVTSKTDNTLQSKDRTLAVEETEIVTRTRQNPDGNVKTKSNSVSLSEDTKNTKRVKHAFPRRNKRLTKNTNDESKEKKDVEMDKVYAKKTARSKNVITHNTTEDETLSTDSVQLQNDYFYNVDNKKQTYPVKRKATFNQSQNKCKRKKQKGRQTNGIDNGRGVSKQIINNDSIDLESGIGIENYKQNITMEKTRVEKKRGKKRKTGRTVVQNDIHSSLSPTKAKRIDRKSSSADRLLKHFSEHSSEEDDSNIVTEDVDLDTFVNYDSCEDSYGINTCHQELAITSLNNNLVVNNEDDTNSVDKYQEKCESIGMRKKISNQGLVGDTVNKIMNYDYGKELMGDVSMEPVSISTISSEKCYSVSRLDKNKQEKELNENFLVNKLQKSGKLDNIEVSEKSKNLNTLSEYGNLADKSISSVSSAYKEIQERNKTFDEKFSQAHEKEMYSQMKRMKTQNGRKNEKSNKPESKRSTNGGKYKSKSKGSKNRKNEISNSSVTQQLTNKCKKNTSNTSNENEYKQLLNSGNKEISVETKNKLSKSRNNGIKSKTESIESEKIKNKAFSKSMHSQYEKGDESSNKKESRREIPNEKGSEQSRNKNNELFSGVENKTLTSDVAKTLPCRIDGYRGSISDFVIPSVENTRSKCKERNKLLKGMPHGSIQNEVTDSKQFSTNLSGEGKVEGQCANEKQNKQSQKKNLDFNISPSTDVDNVVDKKLKRRKRSKSRRSIREVISSSESEGRKSRIDERSPGSFSPRSNSCSSVDANSISMLDHKGTSKRSSSSSPSRKKKEYILSSNKNDRSRNIFENAASVNIIGNLGIESKSQVRHCDLKPNVFDVTSASVEKGKYIDFDETQVKKLEIKPGLGQKLRQTIKSVFISNTRRSSDKTNKISHCSEKENTTL